jgi:hypothetical protein
MKWFLGVCALAGIVGIAVASCGPQKDFCPSTSDNTCHFEDGSAMGGMGGQDLGPCDGGTPIICLNGGAKVCKMSDCPP